jgi:hypothetical protein
MRLLYIEEDGTLNWTGDLIGAKIPPYAILSHTWEEGQEVTFEDLKTRDYEKSLDEEDKGGYRKISFCAKQARCDGLQYFWVDTCCIDKTNSVELQEAINSMFRWYKLSKRCYVYLSDVPSSTPAVGAESDRRWKSAFRKSRWFSRGWTLQELLAPVSVEFFSRQGERLGDKQSCKDTIHEVTGIPVDALLGTSLSDFTEQQRFSWTANRYTMREEDGVYCLFGIFGVYVPLMYGEGKQSAFERLKNHMAASQETWRSKMRVWLSAPDPSINYRKAHRQRQAETGLWLLESAEFKAWEEDARSRLWLHGIPGCGKTVLSSTIVEDLLRHCGNDCGKVIAYFYFDFKDAQKQEPEQMLRSLLDQLSQRSIRTFESIDTLYLNCENGRQIPSQEALLEVIPQVIRGFNQVFVVLDALDECTQRSELMHVLENLIERQLPNMHLLMTSRKERDIEGSLEDYVSAENIICLQSDVVDRDIQRYVRQRLSDDKSLIKWRRDAASRQEIETALMRKARGMYVYSVHNMPTSD